MNNEYTAKVTTVTNIGTLVMKKELIICNRFARQRPWDLHGVVEVAVATVQVNE